MTVTSPSFESLGVPGLDEILAKAQSENFPVALRVLPAETRRDLLALYGFARLVDDVGDELPGGPDERLAALDAVESELDRALDGNPAHPALARVSATIEKRQLDRQLLLDLIEANRLDQRVTRYENYEQLLGYCELSANPVGRMVLGVFGVDHPEAGRLSDLVCTGLQLVEHWQDVVEDASAGRIYVPVEDLRRFGVSEGELSGSGAPSPAFRRLIAFEVGRAKSLLLEGARLVRLLRGTARVAVAGWCGGGMANAAAIERAGYDVLTTRPKASAPAVAAWVARTWRGA